MEADKKKIRNEIEKLNLPIEWEQTYSAMFLRIDRDKVFEKGESKELCCFIIENIVSQALAGQEMLEHLVSFEDETDFYVCGFLSCDPEQMMNFCGRFYRFLSNYYGKENFSCFVSERVCLEQVYITVREMREYDKNNIGNRGKILRFSMRTGDQEAQETILDQKLLLGLLEQGQRVSVMEYLEGCCKRLEAGGEKSIYSMRGFQTELLQGIHVFLYQRGIDAASLFGNPSIGEIEKKAVYSLFDMIRWSTACVNMALEYSSEVVKKKTVADRIEAYLKVHYMENVGRDEVARYVCLTPEYVGKLFKRERGVSLQDYINGLRIETAASLLRNREEKVIDAAVAVGYNNIPYFTTMFKKYMGMTPKEYQKKHRME